MGKNAYFYVWTRPTKLQSYKDVKKDKVLDPGSPFRLLNFELFNLQSALDQFACDASFDTFWMGECVLAQFGHPFWVNVFWRIRFGASFNRFGAFYWKPSG